VFSKAAGNKVNIEHSAAILYTDYEHAEKEIRKTIAFTTASKIKIRWNELTQVKDL
jgi:hypothetical protein